ncbi:MAG: Ppx/GppA phosphatase family protein [Cyanobacteria bacterium P01_A01_bin.123]
MKLAAIDIGTNSIHMIVVQVLQQRNFEVIDREKEMVRLGAGVFATHQLSDRAFHAGLETIERYVNLAEQLGVDEIITAATSAIREAQNGETFLREVIRRTQVTPRIISGQEEARLIFLAVRNAIPLADRNALVLDIGGGSTEAVVGNRDLVLFGTSMKLGVQRLLDMVADEGPMGTDARSVLEAHIRFIAEPVLAKVQPIGFTQVIGTSGTIRNLGEAAYLANRKQSLLSINAEVVQLSELQAVTDRLVELKTDNRTNLGGISDKRTDTIHLGGILLVQLLQMANAQQLTLCDASLREGMILDYLERHPQQIAPGKDYENLRQRKAAQLVYKYESDWTHNCHISVLARQLFDQTQDLHQYGDFERNILDYAALLHDIGQFLTFQGYHKKSRYIIEKACPKGFTDEERLLIGHVIRYHRKAKPKLKHKKFKRLSKQHRQIIWVLAGLLRIAVGLERTKNQQVETVVCRLSDKRIEIVVAGAGDIKIELWAAQQNSEILAKALNRTVRVSEAPAPLTSEAQTTKDRRSVRHDGPIG